MPVLHPDRVIPVQGLSIPALAHSRALSPRTLTRNEERTDKQTCAQKSWSQMGGVSSGGVVPRWGVRPLWSGTYYHLVTWNLSIFLKHITRGRGLTSLSRRSLWASGLCGRAVSGCRPTGGGRCSCHILYTLNSCLHSDPQEKFYHSGKALSIS